MGTLLKRAKLVAWGELAASSGSAAKGPSLLAKVAWSGPDDALAALGDLRFLLCRDGIAVEQATAAAVPLLWELTQAPQVTCRPEILQFLQEIWCSDAWSQAAAALGDSPGYRPKVEWERSAHRAVRAEVMAARRLTQDADPEVALAAQWLVSALGEG
ncbi:hypothetical protein E1264_04080 [Actinomadura sp. KC216]|uniref:hypothetical protein n=1 Tax=Actinomadura sp. KC216 TaxID=2530370 RepID=UPI00104D42D1|nr:hypothetical protein [Actinomadura sp. KC216]TDB90794.1 hypothetical protein E1264_04080 [Actinomadura sp. KC216]